VALNASRKESVDVIYRELRSRSKNFFEARNELADIHDMGFKRDQRMAQGGLISG
jgi:hypothetical protein